MDSSPPVWTAWTNALIIVKPETFVSWHRAGFRLFWRLRSRSKQPGRPKLNNEVRALIQQMVEENPTWGAPRIHGELLKLGFDISERTASRYVRRLSPSDQFSEVGPSAKISIPRSSFFALMEFWRHTAANRSACIGYGPSTEGDIIESKFLTAYGQFSEGGEP